MPSRAGGLDPNTAPPQHGFVTRKSLASFDELSGPEGSDTPAELGTDGKGRSGRGTDESRPRRGIEDYKIQGA